MIRRIRAGRWLALLLGILALAGLPGRAHAHGALRRSVPASGAHLAAAPRALRLTFNEPVELAVARLELLGPGARAVPLSPLRAGDAATTIIADITGPLTEGTYTVVWQIAGADGHPVRGRFRFTIAPGATGLAPATTSTTAVPATVGAAADSTVASMARDSAAHPGAHAGAGHHDPTAMPGAGVPGVFDAESPPYAAVRWLGFVGTLGLIGALGLALAVAPRAARDPLHAAAPGALRRSVDGARRLGLAAAVVVLVASLLRLAAQSVAMHGRADALDAGLVATMVRSTRWGTGWLLQVGGALLAAAGLLAARRIAGAGWALAGLAVLVLAVGAALSGHAAAVPELTALAVASDAAHVAAAGGWLGTLLALVLVGLPAALREPSAARGPTAAALVRAFSPVALACAGAVAVTGVAAAWWHLGSVGALWTSAYGRTLLLKLGVLALVAATGAYNWRRVRPAMGDEQGAHRVRRSSAVELLVGALVLAVTAVLVATPTHTPDPS